jgi:hypothetical protein
LLLIIIFLYIYIYIYISYTAKCGVSVPYLYRCLSLISSAVNLWFSKACCISSFHDLLNLPRFLFQDGVQTVYKNIPVLFSLDNQTISTLLFQFFPVFVIVCCALVLSLIISFLTFSRLNIPSDRYK